MIGATSYVAQRAMLPALAASGTARLVAVASLSERAFETFGAERVHRTYEAVLEDEEVEAVYIPLPNSLHAEWTIRAAEAGKHVLCEKPLATTAPEAEKMAAACAAAGVVLLEGYMTAFHPRTASLEALVRSGGLGEPRFARSVFSFPLRDPANHRWRPEMGGGALLDVGIYCLSPLVMAGGGLPEEVAARAVIAEGGVDASFTGWLGFGSGFTAAFACSFEAPEWQSLEIAGTEAVATVERPFTAGPADRTIRLIRRDGRREEADGGGRDPFRLMAEHMAAVVLEGAPLRRTPAASIELLRLLDRLRGAAGASVSRS